MKTVMVTGHLDLTPEEFTEHYVPKLVQAAECGYSFVVGDGPGCDDMTQRWFHATGIHPSRVVVYHMLVKPRCYVGEFSTSGGYLTDAERDEAMARASDATVGWVRQGRRERNGNVAKNLERRETVNRERARAVRSGLPRYYVSESEQFPVYGIEDPVPRPPPEAAAGSSASLLYKHSVPLPPSLVERYREASRAYWDIQHEIAEWMRKQEQDPV